MIPTLVFVMSLLAVGFISSSAQETREQKLAHASNDLAFDLLRQYKDEKNVFISPISISTALAMVYLGADGHTAETMSQVLKYAPNGLTEPDVREAFQSLSNRLKQNSEDYQFSSVNDVLVQQDFIILHIYGHAVRQYYSANIQSVDFASQGEEIKNRINSGVENSTRGKIKNFLESPPSADTKLFLLNAVYFLGNWKNPFNSEYTSNKTFFNNGNTEKQVPMMHRDGLYEFAINSELNSKVLVLPYKGNNTAEMIIVLPTEKTGVAQVQEAITQDVLNRVRQSAREQRIFLSVPRFNLSYSANLVDALANLGLSELFGNNANLSRMVGDQAKIKVSAIRHKAVIEVNEKGSEAAGATEVEFIQLSLPPNFRVDHPFLFFIREKQNGMILFSGRVDEL